MKKSLSSFEDEITVEVRVRVKAVPFVDGYLIFGQPFYQVWAEKIES